MPLCCFLHVDAPRCPILARLAATAQRMAPAWSALPAPLFFLFQLLQQHRKQSSRERYTERAFVPYVAPSLFDKGVSAVLPSLHRNNGPFISPRLACFHQQPAHCLDTYGYFWGNIFTGYCTYCAVSFRRGRLRIQARVKSILACGAILCGKGLNPAGTSSSCSTLQ